MPSILRGISALFVSMLLLTSAPSRAADAPKFTVEQLDQMLAPIVLFPDALLAQVRAPGGAPGRKRPDDFNVSQDGSVYQKYRGPNTAAIAQAITRFGPDASWTALPAP